MGAQADPDPLRQFEAANYLGRPAKHQLELIPDDPIQPSYLLHHFNDPKAKNPILGLGQAVWDFKGKALASRDFTTHFSVDLMHKDLTLALQLAQQLDVPLPAAATIREVYQMARARGLGASDIVATAAVVDPAIDVS